jgi:hypothetical protein
MPTATDLVTDLPADFEVFGQAVATSMADLLGGTTGQILAKNSATDMDFVWIANDQGDITGITATTPLTGGGSSGAVTVGIQDALTTQKGAVQLSDSTSTTSSILAATPTAVKAAYDLADGAIAKTTVTTAGDIIYRNATVPVRLGIGTAGQVLTVNSGATAPQWSTAAGGGGMTLINSGGTTLSGATTTISSIPGTYNDLAIYIVAARGANDGAAFRVRYNGVSTGYLNAEGTQLDGGTFTFADTFAVLAYSPDNGASTSLQHVVIPNYANTSTWKFAEVYSVALDSTTPTSAQVLFSYGVLNSTSAITSLDFSFSTGNATSGTIYVYGVK